MRATVMVVRVCIWQRMSGTVNQSLFVWSCMTTNTRRCSTWESSLPAFQPSICASVCRKTQSEVLSQTHSQVHTYCTYILKGIIRGVFMGFTTFSVKITVRAYESNFLVIFKMGVDEYQINLDESSICAHVEHKRFSSISIFLFLAVRFAAEFDFRTFDPEGVVLYAVSSHDSWFMLGLRDGCIEVQFKNQHTFKVTSGGKAINDGQWHVVRMSFSPVIPYRCLTCASWWTK